LNILYSKSVIRWEGLPIDILANTAKTKTSENNHKSDDVSNIVKKVKK